MAIANKYVNLDTNHNSVVLFYKEKYNVNVYISNLPVSLESIFLLLVQYKNYQIITNEIPATSQQHFTSAQL